MTFLVTPVVAAMTGLVVWYIQSKIEESRRENERLHDARRKVYAELLEPFVIMLSSVKNPENIEEANKKVSSISYRKAVLEFNLLGTDEAVGAFNELMQFSFKIDDKNPNVASPIQLMKLYGNLQLAIRKNTGNPQNQADRPRYASKPNHGH